MANHERCPGQTIINGVFGLHASTIPDEVSRGVRECDKCFVAFYGEHFTDEELKDMSYGRISWQQTLHLDRCPICTRKWRKMHLPNKVGRTSSGYREAITSP